MSSYSSLSLLIHEPIIFNINYNSAPSTYVFVFFYHVLYETIERKMHLGWAQFLEQEGLIPQPTVFSACS